MQITLIIITGFSIALSPTIKKAIDKLTIHINSPKQVYFFVVLIGAFLTLVSFGWVVITCVLAREFAVRVKGINYPFLIQRLLMKSKLTKCRLKLSQIFQYPDFLTLHSKEDVASSLGN